MRRTPVRDSKRLRDFYRRTPQAVLEAFRLRPQARTVAQQEALDAWLAPRIDALADELIRQRVHLRWFPPTKLSRREIEVLNLLADGMGRPDVAQALCLSLATVRSHIEHIRTKLGAHTLVQAVAIAFRRGLL